MRTFLLTIFLLCFSTFAFGEEKFYRQADEFYQAKDYQNAADFYLKAFETDRKNEAACYNAACCFALLGETKQALELLDKSYQLGMFGFNDDKDFDRIRNEPKFKELVEKAAKELETLQKNIPESIVILPKNFDKNKTYKLIFALHGQGGNPKELEKFYREVAESFDFILVLPYGTTALGKEVFGWETSTSSAEKKVLAELEKVFTSYKIQKNKVVLTGFSRGAYLTYQLGMKNSDLFCGIIPVAGRFELTEDETKIANQTMKVFSIFGSQDDKKLIESNYQAQDFFPGNGVEIRINEFPVGHQFPGDYKELLTEAIEWFCSE